MRLATTLLRFSELRGGWGAKVGMVSHVLATSVPDMDLTNEFQSEEPVAAARLGLRARPTEAAGLTGRARSALDWEMLGDLAMAGLEAWCMRLCCCCPNGATPDWRLMEDMEALLANGGSGGTAGWDE